MNTTISCTTVYCMYLCYNKYGHSNWYCNRWSKSTLKSQPSRSVSIPVTWFPSSVQCQPKQRRWGSQEAVWETSALCSACAQTCHVPAHKCPGERKKEAVHIRRYTVVSQEFIGFKVYSNECPLWSERHMEFEKQSLKCYAYLRWETSCNISPKASVHRWT